MRVQQSIPEGLGSFAAIKRENNPFNVLFTAYISSLNDLAKSGLDIFGVVGYVSSKICTGQPYYTYPPTKSRLDITINDEHVIPLCQSDLLTHNQVVMQAVRLLHDIALYHGTNLVKIIYMIRQLERSHGTKKVVKVQQPEVETQPQQDVPTTEPIIRIKKRDKQETTEQEQPRVAPEVQKARALIERLDNIDVDDGDTTGETVTTNPLLAGFL